MDNNRPWDNQSCGQCYFWFPTQEAPGVSGQCRAGEPKIMVGPPPVQERLNPSTGLIEIIPPNPNARSISSMFPPMVAADPGCGRFQLVEVDPTISSTATEAVPQEV